MFGITGFLTSAIVATALLPGAAVGSMLRRLDAESYLAVMSAPPPNCIIENGFDYVGNDLTNVAGNYDQCCDKCAATTGCTVWSWSNLNGGTCWLKSGRGEIVVNANVKSAVYYRGYVPTCQVANDVDYAGNDLARVYGAKVEDCCSICQQTAGCRAYSWSDYQGGSCWLKSKVTQIITTPGVKSAQAYPAYFGGCPAVLTGYDIVGNDLTNKPSASYSGCCDICKATDKCVAYSWTNLNGGTCWLKKRTGDIIAKDGVISAQVYANSDPQCSIQIDTDFPGNDIANVPGKDATECCDKCRGYTGCNAYSWSNLNGGTCWFKSQKGTPVTKSGVNSAVI